MPTTRPASEKQAAFIKRLIAERISPIDGTPMSEAITDPDAYIAGLDVRGASKVIDLMLSYPKAPRETTPEPPAGVHLVDGTVFKVQKSRTSGNLYAKQLHPDQTNDKGKAEWEYVGRRPFRQLSADTLMTTEQAREFGTFHGVCCVCGINLSAELSVELGIGPVCGKRIHEQERANRREAKAAARNAA